MSSPDEGGGGFKVMLGAAIDLGNRAVNHLSVLAGNSADSVGIFKPIVGTLNNMDVSGQGTVDLGGPVKGRIWMVRELLAFEAGHELQTPGPSQATATGAAGASVSATLPFFSPWMTGFDVEIEPATAAGLATITVTGAGQPALTYYVEESTTAAVSKNIRFPNFGINYQTVTVSAVASGGIATVNVYGTQAGSPAGVAWYVGQPDTSVGTPTQRPPQSSIRWIQNGGNSTSTRLYMPFYTLFGTRDNPVRFPDHLVAYLSGGIGGENFVLGAVVEELRINEWEAMRA